MRLKVIIPNSGMDRDTLMDRKALNLLTMKYWRVPT